MKWMLMLCCAVSALAQQGTTPKSAPDEYPVHAMAGEIGLGGEYMVHGFSRGEAMYIAPDYLVVEVALFPPKGKSVRTAAAAFTLRVNGKKQAIAARSPGLVAQTLEHPEWAEPGGIVAGAGPLIIGGRQPNQQPFPGAPPPGQTRLPPRAPGADDRSGVDREPPVKAEQLLVETALPEGEFKWPVSGFLYFPFKGKAKSVKSVELIYDGTGLKLR
jgi:hypothetical protein